MFTNLLAEELVSERPLKTPILDLLEPLPTPPEGGPSFRTGLAVIGVTAGSLALRIYPLLWLVIGYFTIKFLAVTVHEFGHCMAGWIVGLRVEKIVVGPFSLKRDAGHWKLQASRHLVSGLVYMSMRSITRMRRRLIVYYAGGLVASLATGTIALVLCRAEEIGGNPAFGLPMAGFAIISFVYGVQSLRTLRFPGYSGDGLILQSIVTTFEGARQQIAAHALQMLKVRGVDRSQWNSRWIRVAASVTDAHPSEYDKDWLAYETEGDAEKAVGYLERCLAASGSLNPEEREELLDDLFLEAAFFTAWHRQDPKKASAWFDRAIDPERAWTLTRLRASFALHCVRHDYDLALNEWEQGSQFIQQLPPGPRTEGVKAKWLEWKSQIEARMASSHIATHQLHLPFPI